MFIPIGIPMTSVEYSAIENLGLGLPTQFGVRLGVFGRGNRAGRFMGIQKQLMSRVAMAMTSLRVHITLLITSTKHQSPKLPTRLREFQPQTL